MRQYRCHGWILPLVDRMSVRPPPSHTSLSLLGEFGEQEKQDILQTETSSKCLSNGTTINLYYTGGILWYDVTLQPYFVRKSAIFRSIPVVSAIMRRPAPFGLEDALTNVAVDRGIRRLLVLGRDVPQKSVLRRKCNATLVAIRCRRMNAPGRCRLQRL